MAAAAKSWLKRAGARAVDLLFPPVCVACDQGIDESDEGGCLCQQCRLSLKKSTGPRCGRCAAGVPEIPGNVDSCAHCREHKLRFDQTFCWGPYEGLMQDLLKRMKTDGSRQIANVLGSVLHEEFGAALLASRPTALIPIPLHRRRRHTGAQGASFSLASAVGRRLRLPVYSDLLIWQREASAQVGLSQQGRFRNVHRAMSVNPRYELDRVRLLIVDDVLTTGATCSEAARVLKQAGADAVQVLVAAKTL